MPCLLRTAPATDSATSLRCLDPPWSLQSWKGGDRKDHQGYAHSIQSSMRPVVQFDRRIKTALDKTLDRGAEKLPGGTKGPSWPGVGCDVWVVRCAKGHTTCMTDIQHANMSRRERPFGKRSAWNSGIPSATSCTPPQCNSGDSHNLVGSSDRQTAQSVAFAHGLGPSTDPSSG